MEYVNQSGIDAFISQAQQKIASLGLEITEDFKYDDDYNNKLQLLTELSDLVEALSDPFLTWEEGFVFKVIDYYKYKGDFDQFFFLSLPPYRAPSLILAETFLYVFSHTAYIIDFDISDTVNNFISKAQQKIAALGLEVTDDYLNGDEYLIKLDLIIELSDLISALIDPLNTWTDGFKDKVIGYYYFKANLDQFFFLDLPTYKIIIGPGNGGSNIIVDVDLSPTSTNPVQNKAITVRILDLEADAIYTNALGANVPTSADVGNIPAGTLNSALINRKHNDILTEEFFTELLASVGTEKSVSLDGVATQDLEVGDTFNPALSFVFDKGSINNGDGSVAGDLVGALTSFQITEVFGLSSNGYPVDTLPNLPAIVGEGSNFFSILLNHAAGVTPYFSSYGNVGTNLAAQVAAGNTPDNSDIITGKFKGYFGYSALAVLTSADILALATQAKETSKVASFSGVTAGAGLYTYRVYRASYGDLNSIFQENSLPILTAFTKLADVPVTNPYGVIENYRVYKSNHTEAFSNVKLDFA